MSPRYPVSEWLDLRWDEAVEGGVVRATFVPRPDRHQGAPGYLHGGVAATVLDEVMGHLGMIRFRAKTVTGTLDLRYRQPIPIDATVTAEASAPTSRMDRGSRRHRVQARLLLEDGTVAVEAEGLFVASPHEMRGRRR